MNLLTAGIKANWKRLKLSAGIQATYHGEGTSSTLTVVPGLRQTEAQNNEGIINSSVETDHLIEASTILLNKVQTLPQRGHLIKYTDAGGAKRTYEVMMRGGERHYDPMDQFGLILRVHTREVKG